MTYENIGPIATNFNAVNERFHWVIKSMDRRANLLGVADNFYASGDLTKQTMTWGPEEPNKILDIVYDTFGIAQMAPHVRVWSTELQTANVNLGYTYQPVLPSLLYTTTEADNRISDLEEFSITNVERDYADISTTIRRMLRPMAIKNPIWTEMLKRFDVIAQRGDNWDGLESLKPKDISLVRAKCIMEKLLDSIISSRDEWIEPYICSDEDGYITVEWYGDERELHLRIEENEIEYIQIENIDTKTKAHVDTIDGDNCFVFWKWFINEQ